MRRNGDMSEALCGPKNGLDPEIWNDPDLAPLARHLCRFHCPADVFNQCRNIKPIPGMTLAGITYAESSSLKPLAKQPASEHCSMCPVADRIPIAV